MKCSRMDELLPEYLLGDTDETTKGEVRSHLEECTGCREELESLDFIWSRLGTWPEEKTPEGMRARFYGMLEGYKEGLAQPSRRWRAKARVWTQGWSPVRLAFQSGLALVFLVVGLTAGYLLSSKGRSNVELGELRDEVHQMRQLVALSLLQQQSASERLEGVSWSSRMTSPDEKVISALLDALNYDPNTNVRLAAVDALSNFSDRAPVQAGPDSGAHAPEFTPGPDHAHRSHGANPRTAVGDRSTPAGRGRNDASAGQAARGTRVART